MSKVTKGSELLALSKVTKGSDLLALSEVEELQPKELLAYNKEANAFVDDFNASFPDGKVVKVKITNVNFNPIKGRITFVVAPNNDLSSTAFSYPTSIVDIMGAQLGVANSNGLLLLHHRTGDLQLQMTVVAVKEGDKYKGSDGEERPYKAAAMVRKPGTREEILQGTGAKQVMGRVYDDALRTLVLGTTTNNPAPATPAAAPVEVEEEAEI